MNTAGRESMLADHDQDILLHCRRLGHEVTFGYCRQETGGNPCRWILDCWWKHFDVRGFLQANLTADAMTHLESACASAPTPKILSLLEIIQQAKERLSSQNRDKKA